MPAQGFLSFDSHIFNVLITHVTDVLKLVPKVYFIISKSEAKFGELALTFLRYSKVYSKIK